MVARRRPYRQEKRAASAVATRTRILSAARSLLERRGLVALGLDTVAERAGVARATVFQIYGSKAGLLSAIAEAAAESDEFRALLAALADADAERALLRTVDLGCRFWAKNEGLSRGLSSLSTVDREVARALRAREDARARSLGAVVGRLAESGKLRHGLGRRTATEIVVLATSFAAFDELRQRRALSPRAIARVLRVMVERTLFER